MFIKTIRRVFCRFWISVQKVNDIKWPKWSRPGISQSVTPTWSRNTRKYIRCQKSPGKSKVSPLLTFTRLRIFSADNYKSWWGTNSTLTHGWRKGKWWDHTGKLRDRLVSVTFTFCRIQQSRTYVPTQGGTFAEPGDTHAEIPTNWEAEATGLDSLVRQCRK